MAPRCQVLADSKTGDRHGLLCTGNECGHQFVASGAQHAIDMLDKLALVAVRGSQSPHGLMGEACLARGKLSDLVLHRRQAIPDAGRWDGLLGTPRPDG
jgi:hypothetical protein